MITDPGWINDTVRLARRLPDDVAPEILADRYQALLGWTTQADQAVPWIIFDGPSAVGKDTQIHLTAKVLQRRGLTVLQVGGTGAATGLGPVVRDVVGRNLACPGPSRWDADYHLKAAAWLALRRHLPNRWVADIVLCNRGPLSQVVYSATAGGGDVAATRCASNSGLRIGDLHLLLSCTDDVVVGRARDRIASGEKQRRVVDRPEFIVAANRTYHELARVLPWVQTVDVTRDREQNVTAIVRTIDVFLGDQAAHEWQDGDRADVS